MPPRAVDVRRRSRHAARRRLVRAQDAVARRTRPAVLLEAGRDTRHIGTQRLRVRVNDAHRMFDVGTPCFTGGGGLLQRRHPCRERTIDNVDARPGRRFELHHVRIDLRRQRVGEI